MERVQLPIEAADDVQWIPRPWGRRVLVTGAAGTVGEALGAELGDNFELVALDSRATTHHGYGQVLIGDVADAAQVHDAVARAEYVVHLATGVKRGWQGLIETEIEGTKNVLEAALHHGVHRVVIASSTHSVGWNERLLASGEDPGPISSASPPRPDGLYGAAKVFVEATARFVAEWSGLPVSVLRMGTMRSGASLEELIRSDELPYLGVGAFRRSRLHRSWLTAPDLARFVTDEFDASEPFRMRFATSSPEQREWDHDVFTG